MARIPRKIGDLEIGLAADLEARSNIVLAVDLTEVIGELQVLVGSADGLGEMGTPYTMG